MFLFALLRKVHIIPGKNLSGILEEKTHHAVFIRSYRKLHFRKISGIYSLIDSGNTRPNILPTNCNSQNLKDGF